MRVPPWKSLGMCPRVTNKEKSGFGKASDRAKAEDHRPSGILGPSGRVPCSCLGMCLRVTNEGESGFGKASDRAKAKDHRPHGILGESVVGCPLSRREKARPLFEDYYGVPSLFPKRSSQALRPGPPPKPLSN